MTRRFWIISAHLGLLWSCDDEQTADDIAIRAAVNSGRTVYIHDRLTEV